MELLKKRDWRRQSPVIEIICQDIKSGVHTRRPENVSQNGDLHRSLLLNKVQLFSLSSNIHLLKLFLMKIIMNTYHFRSNLMTSHSGPIALNCALRHQGKPVYTDMCKQ